MVRMMLILVVSVVVFGGCANRNVENDIAMVREVLELAEQDRVEGNMKVHINGQMEAGIKEGVYFGSPGTVVEADLSFRMKDVKATTQPVKE